MKPFDYAAPTTIEEAVALLEEYGERARPLAGGTDLLVQMRRGDVNLDLVVDIKKIPELTNLACDIEGGYRIGAATILEEVIECPGAAMLYPGLIEAISLIGGHATRGRATLGGNLCNAAPSGDSITAMITLGVAAEIAGPEGRRRVPVAEFCTGPRETVLKRGELLVALHVPPPRPHAGSQYESFIPRSKMDISVVGAGAWVALSEDGERIEDARVALAAVAPTPLYAEAASQCLIGQVPGEALFEEAAQHAQAAARPIDDTRGTAAQRRYLVGVLVKRALQRAVERARANTDLMEEMA